MTLTHTELFSKLGLTEAPDHALLSPALTHSSAEKTDNYERLEFLGDAVLKMVVSDWLYHLDGAMSEGEMTKIRAQAVSDATLARVAQTLDLGRHLQLGRAERQAGGRAKESITASALEAVFGAVYLQFGLVRTGECIVRVMAEELALARHAKGENNHKARLQEWTQAHWNCLPEYRVLSMAGPEHNRHYTIGVYLHQQLHGEGQGPSKKSAEQAAAQAALAHLVPDQQPERKLN